VEQGAATAAEQRAEERRRKKREQRRRRRQMEEGTVKQRQGREMAGDFSPSAMNPAKPRAPACSSQ